MAITREELDRMTKEQLHTAAKEHGLAGFETQNKRDLIEAIMAADMKASADAAIDTSSGSASDSRDKRQVGSSVGKSVTLQYNGLHRGALTKYGKTWSNVARRTVDRAEADLLINEFPGRFTIVR